MLLAEYCPICYGVYVNGKNIRTGEPMPDFCKSAGEVKGFPEIPIKKGLILRTSRRSADVSLLVITDAEPQQIINDDFECAHRLHPAPGEHSLEDGYMGIGLGGTMAKGFGDGPYACFGAGLEHVPLRRLWGGHGYYFRATKKDLELLRKIVKEHRLPGGKEPKSWNAAIPLEHLCIKPNPFC